MRFLKRCVLPAPHDSLHSNCHTHAECVAGGETTLTHVQHPHVNMHCMPPIHTAVLLPPPSPACMFFLC